MSRDAKLDKPEAQATTPMTKDQYSRILEYLERKQRGENVGEFVMHRPQSREEATNWKYRYWGEKPVPKVGDVVSLVGIIDPDLEAKSKLTPQSQMYEPYGWVDFDLGDDTEMDAVATFLNRHYTVGDDRFRFQYTRDYLRWALGPGGKLIGIRARTGPAGAGPIGACIGASVRTFQVFSQEYPTSEVNYLCVHPKLREKGLAPLLIDEMTRQMCEKGIVVGFFTSSRYIPTPISRVEFYHRPLDYEKLYRAGFVRLEPNVTLDRAVSTCMIQHRHKHKVQRMSDRHYKTVYNLLCTYQDKYNVYQRYTFDEFVSTFKNSDIVSSFVLLKDDDRNEVLDFYSYYHLPLHVTKSETDPNVPDTVHGVYLHTYTSLNVTQLTIFKSAVLSAYEEGRDVFTCTDIMENMDILFDNFSKFTKGTGYLHYNFFNLTCPDVSPQQICKVTV